MHLTKRTVIEFLIFLGVYAIEGDAVTGNKGTSLYGDLFKNYDRNIFPRCGRGPESIVFTLDMSLRQIVDLKEQSQLLQAMTWMRWSWSDCRLTWNQSDWECPELLVSAERLWVPDITLYEGTGAPLHRMLDYPARVSSNGSVSYNFPAMISTTCKIDMTHFPFDLQKCHLSFTSWAYGKEDIDIYAKEDTADMTNYIHNGEWDLLDLPTKREEFNYSYGVFPQVTIYVVLERRPIYYVFNIIFPTVLIALVAILSFCLPPASGEKVSLSVTALLTQTVFMLMLSQEMPTTSEVVPLLQRYFAAVLCVVSISTIMTIFVLNLHYRGVHGRRVPPVLRKLLLNNFMLKVFHPTLLGPLPNTLQNRYEQRPIVYMNQVEYEHDATEQTGTSPSNGHRPRHVQIQSIPLNTPIKSNGSVSHNSTGRERTRNQSEEHLLLLRQSELLTRLDNRLEKKETDKFILKEWEDLATVVDRIFFILALTAFVITTTVLFMPQYR